MHLKALPVDGTPYYYRLLAAGQHLFDQRATAMGKLIIASRTGGMKEILNCREIGMLVPDMNHVAIANAVIRMIKDTNYRFIIGNNARNFISKNMTWDNIANQTMIVYDKILSN